MRDYHRLFVITLILTCLAVQSSALGSTPSGEGDFLNPTNSAENGATKDQIKQTMQSDLFNVGSQGTSFTSTQGPKNSPMRQSSSVGTDLVKGVGTGAGASIGSGAAPSGAIPAGFAGSWRLDLKDSTERSVVLSLAQSGGVVYGKGSMISGGQTQDVAATGTVDGDKLYMDIVSMGSVGLYKLSLSQSGSALVGSYDAFSPSAQPWTGIATGSASA